MGASFPIKLLLHLTALIYLLGQSTTDADQVGFVIPKSKRTEGRITLEYTRNNETLKHELAFSEVIDSDTKRSKVSIGYISYEPTVYYSRAGNILTLDSTGQCSCLKQLGWKFVPEIDWFLELSYTKEELEKAMPGGKEHHIGPTGIAIMLTRYTKYDHDETHRNIECKVAAARYSREKAKDILLEVFIPNLAMFDNPMRMNFFTIRETVRNAVNDAGETFTATMTLDYFYTEDIDKSNVHHLDKLEEDLNLPFGKGCSKFLSPTYPKSVGTSFILGYRHPLTNSFTVVAYDYQAGFYRKELVGREVMIWDIQEDLLYHLDQGADDRERTKNEDEVQVAYDACSVVRVDHKSAGQLLPPYEQSSLVIEVLELLGAREIAYLGQTTVRELPCQVFEAILKAPPRIFDSSVPRLRVSEKPEDFDYIVLFHIFKTNSNIASKYLDQIVLVGDQFWPARITLTRRDKKSGRSEQLDSLEVTDFHWGLYGWTKKPSELFMMPECFNNEDEQLRINLALSTTNNYSQADTVKALRHNKYKLEQSLLENIFKDLLVSRLHLTEFQMELRPNDVLANLVISDRDEDKKLTYFGPGELPTPTSYQNNRVELTHALELSESTCALLASHVSQVSMVIYCPPRGATQTATCTAIFNEAQPVTKQPANAASSSSSSHADTITDSCQVYRYESGDPPNAATRDTEKVKAHLGGLHFDFSADSGVTMNLKCQVEDFDVSRELQLITINNYRFAPLNSDSSDNSQQRQTVRTYDTISYETLGDCTKMCNLDASCNSYSFCHDISLKQAKCVMSSLDLRQNQVEEQLVRAPSLEDNRVLVYDEQGKMGDKIAYTLELKTSCNIYEKNFLSAFAQTDEILRIEPEVAKAFITKPSATECARWIEWLELQQDNYKSSLFAYCANLNTCLIDENLFLSMNSSREDEPAQDEQADGAASTRELSCQIYRRRYQSYFHVSTKLLKPKKQERAEEHWLKQMDLQFNTVEQCARACWQTFGHTCLSFDFCTPRTCTLNLLDRSKPLPSGELVGDVEYETRAGCLHYERDLKWDQLRRDHLIGHHNPLDLGPTEDGSSGSKGGFLRNFFLFLITGALFIAGLAVGRIFNDRLENVSIPRRSILTEPRGATNGTGRNMQRISSNSKFNIENEIYEDPDAIRMEEFGQRRDASADELNKSSGDSSGITNSGQSASGSRKPNFIDVPNLMQV